MSAMDTQHITALLAARFVVIEAPLHVGVVAAAQQDRHVSTQTPDRSAICPGLFPWRTSTNEHASRSCRVPHRS
jgi:hypothetical protein